MMTRTSRLLKWVGAGTVLLAAAPIAYAQNTGHTGYPSSLATASSTRAGDAVGSAGCGLSASDFAGSYRVVGDGQADATLDFQAGGAVSAHSLGQSAVNGGWLEHGGAIVWTVGGVTHASVAGTATCADPSHAARVTSISATAADGSPTLTLQRF